MKVAILVQVSERELLMSDVRKGSRCSPTTDQLFEGLLTSPLKYPSPLAGICEVYSVAKRDEIDKGHFLGGCHNWKRSWTVSAAVTGIAKSSPCSKSAENAARPILRKSDHRTLSKSPGRQEMASRMTPRQASDRLCLSMTIYEAGKLRESIRPD